MTETAYSHAGQALGSAGPDLSHFLGSHSEVCKNFLRAASRSNDRYWWGCYEGEARKGDVKTSPADTSMDSAVENPINQRIKTFYKNYSLPPLWPDRLPPWSEGRYECSICREERYWVLCQWISRAEKFAVVAKYYIFQG